MFKNFLFLSVSIPEIKGSCNWEKIDLTYIYKLDIQETKNHNYQALIL